MHTGSRTRRCTAAYVAADRDPYYDGAADGEDRHALLRVLFLTGFLADEFFADCGGAGGDAYFGAEQVIVLSASSKTAIGFAQRAAKRAGLAVVGLTSASNVAFVESLGFYDIVRTYDDVGRLPRVPSVIIDMAGNPSVIAEVHAHLGDGVRHSMMVGRSHHDAPPAARGPDRTGPAVLLRPDGHRTATRRVGQRRVPSPIRRGDARIHRRQSLVARGRAPCRPRWCPVGVGGHPRRQRRSERRSDRIVRTGMSRPRLVNAVRSIPAASDRRLAVRVTPDALRHIRAGHPWIFEESVTSISHEATTGDLGVVFDKDRKFVCVALYDPASPIQFKILHAGKPARIDQSWWRSQITRALAVRSVFTEAPDADRLAYRVINGENDGFPGCVVDRYANVLVVKLYSAAWFPHLADLTHALIDTVGGDAVVLRLARNLQHGETFRLSDGDLIAGDDRDVALDRVAFVEAGLEFEADVRAGQKTGHFLDQRANRIRVGSMSAGRDVLDVFASTGGFSVHAAAGAARSVHAVDLSAPTLAAAERNMALNAGREAVAACNFTTQLGDAFEVMAKFGACGGDVRPGGRRPAVVRAAPERSRRGAPGLHAPDTPRPRGWSVPVACSSRRRVRAA